MGKLGVLDDFDFTVVDKTKLISPNFSFPRASATTSSATSSPGTPPSSAARCPRAGPISATSRSSPGSAPCARTSRRRIEAVLMADGVAMDKLYPLDVDRGFKKIKEIKDSIIFWGPSGSESQQSLRDGEVTMGSLWNTRVNAMVSEGAGRAFRLDLEPGGAVRPAPGSCPRAIRPARTSTSSSHRPRSRSARCICSSSTAGRS